MKKFFISIFFFLLLFFNSNCDFKRFEQKKFFCEKNKLDIELIDILETRSIKKSFRFRLLSNWTKRTTSCYFYERF